MSNKDLSIEDKIQINRIITECGCECHTNGLDIMHFTPCCEATYMMPFEIEDVVQSSKS